MIKAENSVASVRMQKRDAGRGVQINDALREMPQKAKI